MGFLTYSEGVNDDVNKFVWSGLGWNPDEPVIEILREFSRYFIGEEYRDSFAQGLLALERNWRGPLLANARWTRRCKSSAIMEQHASPQVKLNWRFQQALYRAYYDSYVRDRLIYETGLEQQAMEKLRDAGRIGSGSPWQQAEEILDRSVTAPVSRDKRQRIFELAEAMLPEHPRTIERRKVPGDRAGRGANLDTIDAAVNNRIWLLDRFNQIRQLPDEAARQKEIASITAWTDPGPGGFYDDLGNPARQPHLVTGLPYADDPDVPALADDRFQHSRHGQRIRTGPELHALSALLGNGYGRLIRRAGATAIYRTGSAGALQGARGLRRRQHESETAHDGERGYRGSRLAVAADPVQAARIRHPRGGDRERRSTLSVFREPATGGAGRGNAVAEVWLIRQ